MLVFVPKMSELCSIIQSCCCRGGGGGGLIFPGKLSTFCTKDSEHLCMQHQ